MEDIPNFANFGGSSRHEEFEALKKVDAFADSLAREVSQTMGHKGAKAIANKILKIAQNDTAFAGKITAKLKDPIGHETISEVDRLIRMSGLLKPTEFYGASKSASAGRRSPEKLEPPQGTRVSRAPKPIIQIIPADRKDELQPLLDAMRGVLSGRVQDATLLGPSVDVYAFLVGKKELQELPLSKENCKEYLTAVKLWDLARALVNREQNSHDSFTVSSYTLRQQIATIGKLSSVEAFTKTLNPKEYENWEYLEKQINWVPERAQLHAKIIETNTIKALALSRRLNTERPSIWAVRGNTGAGKTYTVSKDPLFKRALNDDGTPSGAINPDTFKAALKQSSPGFSHAQLHKEGSALSYQFAEALAKEAIGATMIIDMRLASKNQVEKEVISRAEMRLGEALLMDIETPLITSINRVLTRSPDGEDPIVPLESIRQCYNEIRSERASLLQEVQKNSRVLYYKLYITDESGMQRLAAKKENGVFEIEPGMETAVQKASQKPSPDEVETLLNRVIDDGYIEEAKTRDHIPAGKIDMIARWKGFTVRQALEQHLT